VPPRTRLGRCAVGLALSVGRCACAAGVCFGCPGGDSAVAEAEKARRDAAALVPILNAGGRHSTKILPNPEAVLCLKERLARAIEALGG